MATLPHEKQINEYEETLIKLRGSTDGTQLLSAAEMKKLDKKLEKLKEKVYSKLSPTERLDICRHPQRPRFSDYVQVLAEDFEPLAGDRVFGEDAAIIGGLGRIGGHKFMLIGQEKGHDTESRIHHNFGSPHPEGFRKALRLMELAAKFNIPVVTFVDTQGAFPGLAAEERGQAWAIATNLREMAKLPVPIITVIIGEAGSGGALAIAVGDAIGMLEHGYYSVISPEGCASILWKDASRKGDAAKALRGNAENLLEFGIIDEVISEPLGGAHHNHSLSCDEVRHYILKTYDHLRIIPTDQLLDRRYARYRSMGNFEETNPEP